MAIKEMNGNSEQILVRKVHVHAFLIIQKNINSCVVAAGNKELTKKI
jgi:hypothetical protein